MENESLRFADVVTFLAVQKYASVTRAARHVGVTPSQVSKAISRLESFLRVSLVVRRGRGISLTQAAKEMTFELDELVSKVRSLPRTRMGPPPRLAMAAPSYLARAFFPELAASLTDRRLRAIEAGPAMIRSLASQDLIEGALTLGLEKFPEPWLSTRVGTVRQALFASPALAKVLGSHPTPAALSRVPFVLAVYHGEGEFLPGEDACPLPRRDRLSGHEATTVGVAMEIAATCDEVAYGPELAARPLVEQGRLVEVPIAALVRRDTLYLHVNADRMLAAVQRAVLRRLRPLVEPDHK